MPFGMEMRDQSEEKDMDNIAWRTLMNIAGTDPLLPEIAEFLEQEATGQNPTTNRKENNLAKAAA